MQPWSLQCELLLNYWVSPVDRSKLLLPDATPKFFMWLSNIVWQDEIFELGNVSIISAANAMNLNLIPLNQTIVRRVCFTSPTVESLDQLFVSNVVRIDCKLSTITIFDLDLLWCGLSDSFQNSLIVCCGRIRIVYPTITLSVTWATAPSLNSLDGRRPNFLLSWSNAINGTYCANPSWLFFVHFVVASYI